jgi:hypothetical protein
MNGLDFGDPQIALYLVNVCAGNIDFPQKERPSERAPYDRAVVVVNSA